MGENGYSLLSIRDRLSSRSTRREILAFCSSIVSRKVPSSRPSFMPEAYHADEGNRRFDVMGHIIQKLFHLPVFIKQLLFIFTKGTGSSGSCSLQRFPVHLLYGYPKRHIPDGKAAGKSVPSAEADW